MNMFRRILLGSTWILLALVVAGIGWTTTFAQSATYRVCPAGPPACDYASIQAAVDAASAGDLIQVAEGVYSAVQSRSAPAGYPGPATVNQVLYLAKSLTIQGGYAVGSWTTPDPAAHPTTLNAQGQGRALFVAGDVSPVVQGLTLTGGDATDLGGTSWTDAGGGIYVLTATLTLRDCIIEGNTAGTSTWGGTGGGLYLAFGQAVIRDNTFRNNVAATGGEGYGGGLSLYADGITLRGNDVYSNTASSGDWGYGGGLSLYASGALVSDNAIRDNRASSAAQGYGGGLYVKGGSALIRSNTIEANTASTTADGYGGGLYLDGAVIAVSGNTVRGNTASADAWSYGYGGGFDLWQSDATLSGNIVQDNMASSGAWGYGGGISLSRSGATLVNNVVLGNRAGGRGAGFYVSEGAPLLLHTTVARNSDGDGSGLYLANGSAMTLTNTILVSQTVGITVTAGSQASLDGVLWSGNTANSGGAGGVTVAHPVNGAPAFAADGYHLTAASAALDAGVATGVQVDVDNTPRPYQLPDLGADEYWPPGTLHAVYLPIVLRQSP